MSFLRMTGMWGCPKSVLCFGVPSRKSFSRKVSINLGSLWGAPYGKAFLVTRCL